jgi:hypothetical protein
MSDILNFISKDSSISMTFEMYEAMLYSAKESERKRIIQMLYKWDSLTVFDASDPEDDLKILGEMRRAYQVGYEQSWSDNK